MARTPARAQDEDTRPITLKDRAAIEGMRRAGALVAETLATLRARCLPGVTTAELDRLAHDHIVGRGGTPSFLGYPGESGSFPGSACLSINETIVHGLPGSRALREGDVISIDVGAILDGWHGDAAITVPVGAVDPAVARLIAATEAALTAAIGAARAGNRLADVAAAIERAGRKGGFGIVEGFNGHGIGREMHEAPTVPNIWPRRLGSGPTLRAGMTFTIEPIFTLGTPEWAVLPDGWTAVTLDGGVAAHAEHTIAVTSRGAAEILTRAP